MQNEIILNATLFCSQCSLNTASDFFLQKLSLHLVDSYSSYKLALCVMQQTKSTLSVVSTVYTLWYLNARNCIQLTLLLFSFQHKNTRQTYSKGYSLQ